MNRGPGQRIAELTTPGVDQHDGGGDGGSDDDDYYLLRPSGVADCSKCLICTDSFNPTNILMGMVLLFL